MRNLPDWACANELLTHVLDDKKQACELTVELKLAGEATDNRNKVASDASRFLFVAKVVFVTGTIVPIPIPCVPVFLWKPACFFLFGLLGGAEGGVRRRCRMGIGAVRNYW
jgi:hypothetical protein